METGRSRPGGDTSNPLSPLQTVFLVWLVTTLCYLAAKLGGVLIITVPQTLWALWPGCAALVAILLLCPRRLWPILLAAGLLGFIVYDLQAGVPIRSIARLVLSDTLEILVAALGVTYALRGQPRLDSLNALARYASFTVILASLVAASIGCFSLEGDRWISWRIAFLSEGLAFLTVTPAILGWCGQSQMRGRARRAYHLEAAVLATGLICLSYVVFVARGSSRSPTLLYSLVPFLLWAALRFGLTGASTSASIVALLSIWGAVHGRGPFTESDSINRVFSVQAFLLFTAAPFMVLAVLSEEGQKAEEALHQSEKELLEAQRVAQVGSWQWNSITDEVTWSRELCRIAGRDPSLKPPTFEEQTQLYTAESWERLKRAVAEALRTGTPYTLDLEMVHADGSTRWITDRGEAWRDETGRIIGLHGIAQDITERKNAEGELRASEEKFRRVFRDAGVGMVIVSPEGRLLAANESFCECLGYTEEELLQKTIESVTLPEDWPSFSQRLREALEQGVSFQKVEKRCLHKSGRIVMTESSASLIRGPSGEPWYVVGEVLDITQRKLAEEALSGLSGRLIEAHEEERTWVARELHDDFNQRVALLAMILEKVKQELPNSKHAARSSIEEASQHVAELGSDIQALSHRLHSSKLEYLGLAAAAAGFCRELSTRQNVEIEFHTQDIPKELPQEVALSLFRVLQEALQNAVKHSGVRRFEVSIASAPNEIHLSVQDSGVGFDLQKAMSGHGLGFASMKERMKLIDGHLFIELKPQGGTSIHARAPLRLKTMSTGAGA